MPHVIRQNLQDIIPRRRARSGKKPTLRTVETDDKKERWKFQKPMKKYTDADKARVREALMKEVIKITFQNHYYRWDGRIFLQREGGPIGLRATGSCAKLIMDDWLEKFRSKLEINNIEVFLLTKYVDDMLILCKSVKLGHYWNGSQVVYSRSVHKKHEDSRMNRTAGPGFFRSSCVTFFFVLSTFL